MRMATCLAACVCSVIACASSSAPSKPTSTIQGSVASATFASGAASNIDAVDETGARTRVAVGADGAFTLRVAKSHVYRLVAVTPAGEEPLVFPRSGGRLDTTFRISSGGAVVALGSVRHFDAAPQAFSVVDDGQTQCEGGASGADDHGDGECENRKDAITGQACADDGQGPDIVDRAKPMAVPEKNPPNDVAGCDDGQDGEQADD